MSLNPFKKAPAIRTPSKVSGGDSSKLSREGGNLPTVAPGTTGQNPYGYTLVNPQNPAVTSGAGGGLTTTGPYTGGGTVSGGSGGRYQSPDDRRASEQAFAQAEAQKQQQTQQQAQAKAQAEAQAKAQAEQKRLLEQARARNIKVNQSGSVEIGYGVNKQKFSGNQYIAQVGMTANQYSAKIKAEAVSRGEIKQREAYKTSFKGTLAPTEQAQETRTSEGITIPLAYTTPQKFVGPSITEVPKKESRPSFFGLRLLTKEERKNRTMSLPFGLNPPAKIGGNDLQFKRDVLGKSGVYYALPYVGQQVSKGVKAIPIVGPLVKKLDRPAPQIATTIVYTAGPSLLFGPAIPSTGEFQSRLITSKSIIPTKETIFKSEVKSLGEDKFSITTKSKTQLGGTVDFYSFGGGIAKANEQVSSGVGRSFSVVQLKKGVVGVTKEKSVFSSMIVGENKDITAVVSRSVGKQYSSQIRSQVNTPTGVLIQKLKPQKGLTYNQMFGATRPIGENTLLYAGKGPNAQEALGIIKFTESPSSTSVTSQGVSRITPELKGPVLKAIESQVSSQSMTPSLITPKSTGITRPSITGSVVANKPITTTMQPVITQQQSYQRSIPTQRLVPISTTQVETRTLTRLEPIVRTQQGTGQSQKVTPITAQLNIPIQKPAQKQVQRLTQRMAQPLQLKQKQSMGRPIPIIPNIPMPKTSVIPRGLVIPKGYPKPLKLGTFGVEVRRGGKFRSVGQFGSIKEAFGAGRERVSSTLGATFKLTGTGAFPKSTPGFYTKKTKGGTLFIEKRKFRLSRTGEKKEIRLAKILKGPTLRRMKK